MIVFKKKILCGSICTWDFTVSHGGRRYIVEHIDTEKHKSCVNSIVKNMILYFLKKEAKSTSSVQSFLLG